MRIKGTKRLRREKKFWVVGLGGVKVFCPVYLKMALTTANKIDK